MCVSVCVSVCVWCVCVCIFIVNGLVMMKGRWPYFITGAGGAIDAAAIASIDPPPEEKERERENGAVHRDR